jgi:hypothetical protein
MNALKAILALMLGLVLTACATGLDPGPSIATERSPSPPVVSETDDLANLVDVELDLPEEVPHNQRAGIRLQVHNRHPEAHLAISNARYDLRVLQEDGTEVHRTGQNLGEPGRYPTLPPGETLDYRIIWPQLSEGRCTSDQLGQCRDNPAPPGRYDVRATFLAGFAQVLQDGETLAAVEDGSVVVDLAEIVITEEEGDPDARPFKSPVDEDNPLRTHPAQRLSGGIRAPEQVDEGGTAQFRVILGNNFDEPLEVPFRQPMYDFTVNTLDGTELWRWSEGQETSNTPVILHLEPGQWEEPEVEWNLRDRNGSPVPPDWYEVQGWLRLAPEGERAWLRQLMFVGPRPALEEVVRVSLEAPDAVAAGEPVPVKFTIKNATDDIVRLYHGADYVTFEVLDEAAEKVWPGLQVFPAWGAVMELLPGQIRQVERVWPQERVKEGDEPWNPEREPAPPGRYTIVGWFKATVGDDTTDVVENKEEVQLEPHSLEVRHPAP